MRNRVPELGLIALACMLAGCASQRGTPDNEPSDDELGWGINLSGHIKAFERDKMYGQIVFGEPIPESGTPLYTDVRLYGERGVPAVIYGAGPRTVLESNAKRADECLVLADLRRATQVIARTLFDLLG